MERTLLLEEKITIKPLVITGDRRHPHVFEGKDFIPWHITRPCLSSDSEDSPKTQRHSEDPIIFLTPCFENAAFHSLSV